MATQKSAANVTLRLSQTYPFTRDKVFEAWTEAQALARWFAPSNEYTVAVRELEVRVGGAYRIEMRRSEDHVSCVVGRYLEIDRPSRLKFTWKWEGEPDHGETVVTVDFHDRGGATEVVLTHERLVSEESRDQHRHGWEGCLERLESMLESKVH